MKTKVALFECCGQHIELIPDGDWGLLARLTCLDKTHILDSGIDKAVYCEDRWICNKLAEDYRKCKEIEGGVREAVKRHENTHAV